MKWKYFAGACLVVGGALLKAGAPVLAIAAGLALAALANFLRYRASTRA
jgi:NAD(P)H-hydrate repair Nnr-like enzyme with NAD(P)H-hydrate dehydratase domain